MPYYRQVKEHYLAMDFSEKLVWVSNVGSEVFDA